MHTDGPIILFTPYFASTTPERQLELDECLRRNVACDVIQKIFLLIDDGRHPPLSDKKVEVVHVAGRPTYRQWVDLSQMKGRSGISILANSDIYFDATLENIRQIFCRTHAFVALSRHERRADTITPHPNPHWSQDVWALHTAADIPDSLKRALDIPLGVPRCDNKVAYCFAVHGWNLFNPLHFIHGIHVHETQQRNYDKKADLTVMGGVAYVHPSRALVEPAQVEIDIWAKNAEAISAVRLNKTLDLWVGESKKVQPAVDRGRSTQAPRDTVRRQDRSRIPAGPANHPASVEERYEFVTQGKVVFDYLRRFQIYRYRDELLCLDWLQPALTRKVPLAAMPLAPNNGASLPQDLLVHFIPPLLDIRPIIIRDRPQQSKDCHFWQYPCTTEKQAYDNQRGIQAGCRIDSARGIIHTYLGLPWATYIDKKYFLEDVLPRLRPRVSGYKRLARAHGYELALHTVCQHIHWRRLVDRFHEVGITDLHLSHCEKSIDTQRDGYHFRIHSWPLIAVNIEEPSRSAGLRVGKPIAEKRYLASFIGAHMPHYRTNIRLRLLEAARADGGDDLLVDLGDEWHFNKIVYQEQVQNKALQPPERQEHDAATLRYNQTLSDSIFSLCPEGAGPNSLRIWESLAVGAIPVVIAEEWIPPAIPGSGPGLEDCCIFVTAAELQGLFSRLRAIELTKIKAMQAACIKAYERIRALRAY